MARSSASMYKYPARVRNSALNKTNVITVYKTYFPFFFLANFSNNFIPPHNQRSQQELGMHTYKYPVIFYLILQLFSTIFKKFFAKMRIFISVLSCFSKKHSFFGKEIRISTLDFLFSLCYTIGINLIGRIL